MERAIWLLCALIFMGPAVKANEKTKLEKMRESISLNQMYAYDTGSFHRVADPFLKKIKEVHGECVALDQIHTPSGFFLGTERENRQKYINIRNIDEARRNQSVRIDRFTKLMNWRFDEAIEALEKNIQDEIFRDEVVSHFKSQKEYTNQFIDELNTLIEKGDFKTCSEQLGQLIEQAEKSNGGKSGK